MTPKDMNGYVLIFGEMLNFLDFLVRPGICSVNMYDNSIVLPYSILAVLLFEIITGAIVGMD